MATSLSDSGVQFADTSLQASAAANQIQTINSSVAASALTVTVGAGSLAFRNTNAAVGTIVTISVGALSIVVPSTATLGTVSAVASRLVLLEAYNAGAPVACITNLAGGLQLDETNLISPTTISVGATSASIIYSNSAVSANSPYRVVGFIDITEATAGTWATAASNVQGAGGQALKSLPTNSMVRLNTANGYGTTNTLIRRFLTTVTSQGTDITYADSATLGGTFTINANGVYSISYSDNFNVGNFSGVSLNSTQLSTAISAINASDIVVLGLNTNSTNSQTTCAATMYLKVGDVIRAHVNTASAVGSTPNGIQFIITKVSS